MFEWPSSMEECQQTFFPNELVSSRRSQRRFGAAPGGHKTALPEPERRADPAFIDPAAHGSASAASNLRSITHLASCPSRNRPTNSSDEPNQKTNFKLTHRRSFLRSAKKAE